MRAGRCACARGRRPRTTSRSVCAGCAWPSTSTVNKLPCSHPRAAATCARSTTSRTPAKVRPPAASLTAPMPGKLIAYMAKPGDRGGSRPGAGGDRGDEDGAHHPRAARRRRARVASMRRATRSARAASCCGWTEDWTRGPGRGLAPAEGPAAIQAAGISPRSDSDAAPNRMATTPATTTTLASCRIPSCRSGRRAAALSIDAPRNAVARRAQVVSAAGIAHQQHVARRTAGASAGGRRRCPARFRAAARSGFAWRAAGDGWYCDPSSLLLPCRHSVRRAARAPSRK